MISLTGPAVAAPGTVVIVPIDIGEQLTAGGIVLPSVKSQYEQLCYGEVIECGAYLDRHGQFYERVTHWPIPKGALIEYKHNPWLGKVSGAAELCVNSDNVTRWWAPGAWRKGK
jgi:hypothetical protein